MLTLMGGCKNLWEPTRAWFPCDFLPPFSLCLPPRRDGLPPRPRRCVSAARRARLFARPWEGGTGRIPGRLLGEPGRGRAGVGLVLAWPGRRAQLCPRRGQRRSEGAGMALSLPGGGSGLLPCSLFPVPCSMFPVPCWREAAGPSPCPAPVTGVGVRMEEAGGGGGGGGRREAGGGGGGRGPPCLWLVSSRWRQASMCESRLA